MLTFPVRTMPSIFPCLKSCIGLPQSNCDTCRSGDDSVVSLEMERPRAGFQKEYLKLVGEGLTSVMSGEWKNRIRELLRDTEIIALLKAESATKYYKSWPRNCSLDCALAKTTERNSQTGEEICRLSEAAIHRSEERSFPNCLMKHSESSPAPSRTIKRRTRNA
jgi:hypothetical protein